MIINPYILHTTYTEEPAIPYTGNGCLYNGYAIHSGKLAPVGWHVFSGDDIDILTSYLASNVGSKLKETGLIHWDSPNNDATNESGFTALGSGRRGDLYEYLKSRFYMWTTYTYTTIEDITLYYAIYLSKDDGEFTSEPLSQDYGCSVRCLLDGVDPADPGSVTDASGNVYPTVKIGTQVWMASNLKVTKYTDDDPIPNVTGDEAWMALTTGAYCWYNNTPE